jgi:hypothetical protein
MPRIFWEDLRTGDRFYMNTAPSSISGKHLISDFEDGTSQGWQASRPDNYGSYSTIAVENLGIDNKALMINYAFHDKIEQTYNDAIYLEYDNLMDLNGYAGFSYDITYRPSAMESKPYAPGDGSYFIGHLDIGVVTSPSGEGIYTAHSASQVGNPSSDLVPQNERITVRCYSKFDTDEGEIGNNKQVFFSLKAKIVDYSAPLYIDNICLLEEINLPQEAAHKTFNVLTPVEKYGRLQVIGSQICDERGNPVQLTGNTFSLITYCPSGINRQNFQALIYDWKCDVIRLGIDPAKEGDCYGYDGSAEKLALVEKAINLAIEEGVYVIFDWAVLEWGDPNHPNYGDTSAIFDLFSAKYAGVPNIIWGICSEPNTDSVTWSNQVKSYANRIIPVIRANDPDQLIMGGSSHWSADLTAQAADPLVGYNNIVYSYHCYPLPSGEPDFRNDIQTALNAGLAVFVTEFGTTTGWSEKAFTPHCFRQE